MNELPPTGVPGAAREEAEEDRVLDPGRARKLLREAVAGGGLEILAVRGGEIAKRRPGRRLTVRYRVEARFDHAPPHERVIYAKFYSGRKGERVFPALVALSEAAPGRLALPEPLGYSARRKLLVMGGLEGLALDPVLRAEARGATRPEPPVKGAAAALPRVAAAVAAFHALLPSLRGAAGPASEALRRHDAPAEREILVSASRRIETLDLPPRIVGSHREAVDLTCARLTASSAPARATTSVLHRDLHPGQVLLCGRRVGLLDLDEVAEGEPELDVGNFLAHLVLVSLQEDGRPERLDEWTSAFVAAYREQRPLEDDRLDTYAAAALLRLASLERLSRSEVSRMDRTQLARELTLAARRRLQRG